MKMWLALFAFTALLSGCRQQVLVKDLSQPLSILRAQNTEQVNEATYESTDDYLIRTIPGYAGIYYENNLHFSGNEVYAVLLAGRTTDKMTDKERLSIEKILLPLYAKNTSTTSFVFYDAKYTLRQLKRFQDIISTRMNTAGGVSSSDLDIVNNTINIYLTDIEIKKYVQNEVEGLGIPKDAFVVQGLSRFYFTEDNQ